MFIRFCGGLCKVYAVYTFVCIFIGGTVNGIFYRSFVRVLVGWWWAAAAGSGSLLLLVGVVLCFLNLKEFCKIKLPHIPLKLGGILHFFGVFAAGFSLRLVHLFTHDSKPYRLLPIPYPPTYSNGLPNGKTHQISLSHYPTPNSNYLKINSYTTITNLLHYNYINLNISTSSTLLL